MRSTGPCASVPDLTTLLDPARGGGHAFSFDLSAADRGALVAWLETL